MISGGDLGCIIELYGPVYEPQNEHLTLSTVAWYTCQLCRAVSYLHSKKIMSRDIKDENCMINQYRGSLVLIDLGTVKDINDLQPTANATFAGTPMYLKIVTF